VAPSATLWHATSSAPAGGPAPVAVAAGPRLPGGEAEARTVAAVHRTTALVGAAATAEAVLAALDGAGLAHLAAHGRLSRDNPLFSNLLLADGPLVAYDLERLPRVPHTVVLAACDAGRSLVSAGDELLGLAAAFVGRGAATIVASVVPVADAGTAPLMVAFHCGLIAGQPPAAALATAQHELAAQDPANLAATAGFVCIGAGFLAPPLPARAAG
jgi:CHAT domain-containing protein